MAIIPVFNIPVANIEAALRGVDNIQLANWLTLDHMDLSIGKIQELIIKFGGREENQLFTWLVSYLPIYYVLGDKNWNVLD